MCSRPLGLSGLVGSLLLVACGSRSDLIGTPGGPSDGGPGDASVAIAASDDGGGDAGQADALAAASCTTIDVTSYDQSCTKDSDCLAVVAGTFCPGQCTCATGAINLGEAMRYKQALAPLRECSCPGVGAPTCADGRCKL